MTKAGRIFWLSLTTGGSRQVVGRTPVAGYFTYDNGYYSPPAWYVYYGVPGGLFAVSGIGLSKLRKTEDTLTAPDTLAGVRITYRETALPILQVAPDPVLIQLPWDLPVDVLHPSTFSVETDADDADFQTPLLQVLVSTVGTWGGFESGANGQTIAIHTAFDSLVTKQNPARSGERVHLYARGLGPVDPAVPVGNPGPSNPPAHLVTPLQCRADYIIRAEAGWQPVGATARRLWGHGAVVPE